MFLNQIKITQHSICYLLLISFIFLLTSCTVTNVQKNVSLSSAKPWVVLPFQNNSQTPRASHQVEEIIATLLRIRGISNIEPYHQLETENKNEWPEINTKHRESTLLNSLKDNYSYAVTGSVDEWQYKLGVGNEPAVGLTVRVIEIPTGKIVWSASGARSGWSMESLNGVAQKLITDLISNLEIEKS